MHRARMLRMVGMVVRMKEIMTVFMDVRKCPVLILSLPVSMFMAMEVLIMFFIGIFGVVMVMPVRNLMVVPVVMIAVMMFMITPFMRMISVGFFYLPFLFLCDERITMNVMHGVCYPR